MKLWLDDVRPAPKGYLRAYFVEQAISEIMRYEKEADYAMKQYVLGYWPIEKAKKYIDAFTFTEISCDHDLGEGNHDGIKLLDWLEATGRNYPIHIHSMNPVGVENMRRIIQKNGWKEV